MAASSARVTFVDPDEEKLQLRLQAAAALPGKRKAEQQLRLLERQDAVEKERKKAAAAAAVAKQKLEVGDQMLAPAHILFQRAK